MKFGFIGGKFLPLHLGHVNAIIQAANQCDKLYVILSFSKKRDYNLCCVKGNIKYITEKIRLSWLKQLTKDMDNVEVVSIEDNYDSDETYNWTEGANQIKKIIGNNIDFVFSSEESYIKIFAKLYPEAEHIIIDSERSFQDISATRIREEGPFQNWNFLPDFVRSFFVKKIVIVGTESCGKSTLIRNLSKLYNTNYVEEYGRVMCDEKCGSDEVLTPDLFPYIAYGHKMLEYEKTKSANKIIFIDTESLVTKFYLELYSKIKDPLYEQIAKNQDYDLWVYLEPDVNWIDDGLRKHGREEIRIKNNVKLKQILDKNEVKYNIIDGSYQERFKKIVQLIEQKILVG